MNTGLVVASGTEVIPKPTKTEIIDALVERAKVKLHKENEDRKAKRAEVWARIEKSAVALFKKERKPEPEVEINWKGCLQVSLELELHPKGALADLLREYRSLEGSIVFNEKEERKRFREELSGRKPGRLLEDPKMVEALDGLLEKINSEGGDE